MDYKLRFTFGKHFVDCSVCHSICELRVGRHKDDKVKFEMSDTL